MEQGADDRRDAAGPGEASRQVFDYPLKRTVLPAIPVYMGLLFLIGFTVVALNGRRPLSEAVYPILFAVLFVLLPIAGVLRYRPIALGGDRIEALLGNRAWRTIDWRDVDRIEKRAVPAEMSAEGGIASAHELIVIRSGRRTITVDSTLYEFAALKRRLAAEAKRRGIELMLAEPQPLWFAPLLTQLDEL